MKLTKTFSLAAVIVSGVLLAGCSAKPSNTIHFSPASPTATVAFNTMNQKAIVNVVTKDERAKSEISTYTDSGSLVKLSASPEVAQLFQQVMQQDLNAKGFRLANAEANTQVLVRVKDFYAQVDEGNLRHKISSHVQLEIHVQGMRGNFTKNIGASRVDEGVLGVNNADIQKSLTLALQDVVNALHKDREIADAIYRYTN